MATKSMTMSTPFIEVINIGVETARQSSPLTTGISGGVDINGQETTPKIRKFKIKITKPTKPGGKPTYSILRELPQTSSMRQDYVERFVETCTNSTTVASKMGKRKGGSKLTSTKVCDGLNIERKHPLKATAKKSSALVRKKWKCAVKRAPIQGKQQQEKQDGSQALVARRNQIGQRIVEALSKVYGELKNPEAFPTVDIAKIAKDIESALFLQLGSLTHTSGVHVTHQYRSIMFNLGDPKNPDFRRAVLSGRIKAQQLPFMDTRDMANKKQKEEYQQFLLKKY